MLKLCNTLLVAFVVLQGSAYAQQETEKEPKAVLLGGEWTPEKDLTSASQYRGCLVNKTYSTLNLTIVRPTFTTTITLPPGAHYRIALYHGEAAFVSSNPATGAILAVKTFDVGGETTVYVRPSALDFVRGVNDCLHLGQEASKQGE